MGKTSKIVWTIVLVVVVVGFIWWGVSKNGGASSGNTIAIGFIGPLTGDAAVYGQPVQNGVKLAVAQINAAGGIDGKQIVVDYEDGKCDGQDAASAAQKLVNIDQVKYIVGGVCSAEAFSFEPIIAAAKVFTIMPGASAPKLAGLSDYLMRNNPNDNVTGAAVADYMAKYYKNPAIISEETDYSQGIKTVFIAQAKKDNLNLVSAEDYNSDASDFRTLLTNVKAAHPDVIWINAQTSANLIRIGMQARQLGIAAPFVTAPFNDATVASTSALDGLVTATPPGLANVGKGAEFVAAYTAAYGAPPQYSFYAGAAYDDVYLIAQAISTAGNDPTKVEQYLHALPSYTGTIGTYHFDQNGDVVGINPIFQKLENGKFVDL